MKYSAVDASPLYIGKERDLADSLLKIEVIIRINERFNELKPGIGKISVNLVDI